MPSWFAYVPRYVADDLLQFPDDSPIRRDSRFDAVALFADVSGFTPMSEALGKTGRGGTEELTAILNRYFDPMIDLIHSYGGIIGKFGGDAMTVLFPYDDDTQGHVVRRAMQCALIMQDRMIDYKGIETSAGQFDLAMKAGLAMGSIYTSTVGDPDLRLEYIIAGETLDFCADAEHEANPGEVVVRNDMLPVAGHVDVGEERGDFSLIRGLPNAESPVSTTTLPEPPPSLIPTLERFLHPTVAHRIAADQARFINEHRKVTVLFVSFNPFNYDTDRTVRLKMQAYFQQVVRTINRYDGFLNKIDMGDKGSKYIALFGAPLAHENDEERAIRCAIDLSSLPGVEVRIGINTGFVYAGQVGSETRQEYTVMGDVVNLAARLMQAAQARQILISGETQAIVADAFVWEQFEPIAVKGKTQAITVYGVHGIVEAQAEGLREPHYTLPMIGRRDELAAISALMDQAIDSAGQIVGIVADAGMGKSRLAAEVIRTAVEKGFAGYGGACQSYGATMSYLVWHSIWRGFFGVDHHASVEEQIAGLAEQLIDIDPTLEQRLPLLGFALNIAIPDNEFTAALEPELRHELLHELLLECIRHRADQTPLMLVIEDRHWIDTLSMQLLEFLGRNMIGLPIFIVVIYRPLDTLQSASPLHHLPHFNEFRLPEFSPQETRQLIDLKLAELFGADRRISERILAQIVERSQGNPFYVEELINYMHDAGIDPTDMEALAALDLPDNLYSLILSRIDRLAENEKITLKVASVIGRLFRASWLWGFYPDMGSPDEIRDTLSVLSGADLTPLDKPEPELEYLFKHILTQEVAYGTLAYALRSALHNQLGQFIEERYPTTLENYVEILAYHFGQSDNVAKQRTYFRWAGDHAKENYANDAALTYYERLLPLLLESDQVDVMLQMGEVWRLIGQWDDAEAIFRDALSIADILSDDLARARCLDAIGYVFTTRGDYGEALTWFEQAHQVAEQLGNPPQLLSVYEHLGYTHWIAANFDEAIEFASQHLEMASEADNHKGISDALRNLGGVYMFQENFPAAIDAFERSFQAATEHHYQQGAIYSSANLGMTYGMSGDFFRAIQQYNQALLVAQEIGYLQSIGSLVNNIGEEYRLLGAYRESMACNEYALSVLIDLGDWRTTMVSLGNIAAIFALQGRHSAAEPLFERTLRIGRTFELGYFACEYLQAYADMLTQLGRYDEAAPLNQDALNLARDNGRAEIEFEAQILGIRLEVLGQTLDVDSGIEQLEDLVGTTDDIGEQAALYDAIWQLDNHQTDARQQAADLYAQAYDDSPNAVYRRRYQVLTGDTLPPPPELPPLPTVIATRTTDLDTEVNRLEILMSEEVFGQ
jgi:class 3 adenylate cyclase/tetratricopeptide (TPR) repeat protein